jgi:hypothetical protein
VLLGLALLAAVAAPTQITGMQLRQDHGRVSIRVRVCGAPGRVAFHVTETSSPPAQRATCARHRITWTLGQKFFGVSRYRVAVRARTSGRRWSSVVARHRDTFD